MDIQDANPSGFRTASREILEYLSAHSGMALWMVTRVNGEEWIVIDVVDKFYDVYPMRMHDWSDSFSYRMIMGLGPKVAPRVSEVPAYVNSVAYERSQIGAYIAIPLELPDGRLFGVISGVNPDPMSDKLHSLLPELEAFGSCLMQVYNAEVLAAKLETKITHLESPHWRDEESGALRFEAWLSDCIDVEQARVNYLEAAGLVYVHIPDCDPDSALFAARKLHDFGGEVGTVYREDAENFILMLRGPDKTEQQAIAKDVRKAFDKRIPSAKCAYIYRDPLSTMTAAFAEVKKLAHAKPRVRKAA